jgi:protein translocase SecG subunit
MGAFLIIIFIIAGVVFSWSVLLMSPKWWLGFGIGGSMGWSSNEYGSKKSVETTLKKTAFYAAIVLVASSLFLPYMLK